jgi:acetyl esterase/lipase
MARRIAVLILLCVSVLASAQERIRDLIYMKQAGAAFTMDVFKPKNPNGAAIIFLVSGGWFSSHDNINPQLAEGLNSEGFTVFQVVHGAQPRYKIQEISKQITRAVRFIRANAATYGVDSERLGLTGASAGGHLSLMTAGTADEGNPSATDPVEKQASRVAAVVAIFPPTHFLHYGTYTAQTLLKSPMFAPFRPAFGLPATPTDEQIDKIAREVSPIYTVTAKFPPTLLIHGDADVLVPVQQSQVFRDALSKAGVVNDLMVVKGGGHDGTTVTPGMPRLVAWFKEKLAKKG